MTHRCLDACSLINLFCGWGGLQELHVLGGAWSISQSAMHEVAHVNGWHSDGSVAKRKICAEEICRGAPLTIYRASTGQELATLARLAAIVDDGEAECIALAKHRGWTLVSDDKLAVSQAAVEGVQCISSLELVRSWIELTPDGKARQVEVARRIRMLANYIPPTRCAHREWWDSLQS